MSPDTLSPAAPQAPPGDGKQTLSAEEGTSSRAKPKRLVSLDAFRGLAVLGMLLVNNKALGPWTPSQLTHASWSEGVHAADVVYPWFLLIVGVAIPYSFASSRARGVAPLRQLGRTLTRAIVIVLLGVLVNSSYARHPLFDLGVLQLIGFAYLFGAMLYGLPRPARAGAAALLLLGHWAALRFVPVPGGVPHAFTETHNLVVHLNTIYLDQLGLSNLPSVATTTALVLIGTLFGDLIRGGDEARSRTARTLLLWGAVMLVVGLLWSLDQPMVKRLWTSPYILFAAGTGAMVLSLCYWLIDGKGYRAWCYPLVVLGRNAITAFVLPILVNIYLLDGWRWPGTTRSVGQTLLGWLTNHLGAGPGGLTFTLGFLVCWWLVFFAMYRKRVFLRI